jgi:subtilisin family serine protease
LPRSPASGSILGVLVFAVLLVSATAQAASSRPNDYYFATGGQWALTGAPASINAPAAWCMSTGAGVLVADVDSGADFSHPDLAGKLVAGASFLSADGSGRLTGSGPAAVSDDNGHGTLTTGLIVARTNNRGGIAAVAPDARALVVKVVDASGRGSGSDVAAGMRWAVDHGAQVLNVSIVPTQVDLSDGVSGASPIADAVDYAGQHGAAVAFAAGNDSSGFNSYQLLENKPNALVVGALARDGSVPSYSNGGASIYAPGGDGYNGPDPFALIAHNVVSTFAGGGYGTAAGTSVATPMVAGVLALLMAHGFAADGAKAQILATARPGQAPALDAAAALGTSPSRTCGVAAAAAPVRPTSLRTAPPEITARPRPSVQSTPTPAPASRGTASIELVLPPARPQPQAVVPRNARARPALFVVAALMVAVTAVSARRFL